MAYGRSHRAPSADTSSFGCLAHRSLLQAIRLRDLHKGAKLMREHLAQLESQLQFTQPVTESPDLIALYARAAPVAAPVAATVVRQA